MRKQLPKDFVIVAQLLLTKLKGQPKKTEKVEFFGMIFWKNKGGLVLTPPLIFIIAMMRIWR